MFGGIAFFRKGNIVFGVWKRSLIVRLGSAAATERDEPHVRPFDITGKPMHNRVMIDPEGLATDAELADWIARELAFARKFPPKND